MVQSQTPKTRQAKHIHGLITPGDMESHQSQVGREVDVHIVLGLADYEHNRCHSAVLPCLAVSRNACRNGSGCYDSVAMK